MRNIYLFLILLFLLGSCGSKNATEDKIDVKKEIESSLRKFTTAEFSKSPDFSSIDSVVATKIDSISEKEFMRDHRAFLYKKWSHYNELINAQMDLTTSQLGMQQLMIESGSKSHAKKYQSVVDDSYNDVMKTNATMDSLSEVIKALDKKLLSNTIDSTSFAYYSADFYLVVTKKNNAQEKVDNLHMMLTKDFKIIDPRTIK